VLEDAVVAFLTSASAVEILAGELLGIVTEIAVFAS
jgi:hypothetical protein